jgi:hypothetical protein
VEDHEQENGEEELGRGGVAHDPVVVQANDELEVGAAEPRQKADPRRAAATAAPSAIGRLRE